MNTYRVIITGEKYPTEYIVQASGWHTGISRAIKEWKKRFKGSRAEALKIVAVKQGKFLINNEKED